MQYSEINSEELRDLIKNKNLEELRKVVATLDPADAADIIEELDKEEQELFLDLMDPETASEVVAEMEPGSLDDFLEKSSVNEIAELIENMPPDDAVDFIIELDEPREKITEIIKQISSEEHKVDIAKLLKYKEDSAGSIMTPELCALPATTLVKDALKAIGQADLSDPIIQVFVIEEKSGVLLGHVHLSTLISVEPESTLEAIVSKDYIWTTAHSDKEKIAKDFRKYNLWVMPVVDEKHHLVGRITADDIMDVIQEEADEDMALMIGAPDFDETENSSIKTASRRLPWLMITLVAGVINSVIIKQMLGVINITAIVIFVPVIMAMGGNTSIQASAIAIKEIVQGKDILEKIIKKIRLQVLVGCWMGVVCGLMTALASYFVIVKTGMVLNSLVSPLRLCLVIGASMFNSMVFSSLYGSMVPLILHKMRIDPAIASGPFVTTSSDLSASAIYFLTCFVFLH